jgi:hypothetical protein
MLLAWKSKARATDPGTSVQEELRRLRRENVD